jgi:hypothetical protein
VRRGFTRRGQPLIVLMLLLGGWVSARAMMWDGSAVGTPPQATLFASNALPTNALAPRSVQNAGPAPLSLPSAALVVRQEQSGLPPASSTPYAPAARPMINLPPSAPVRVAPRWNPSSQPRQPSLGASGHQMLWMAALAQIGSPFDGMRLQPSNGIIEPLHARDRKADRSEPKLSVPRWSGDSWFLWRSGGQPALAGGILSPSYGASQAGAILRYRLAPGSKLRPTAYLRTTTALGGSAEREAALGLSLRPLSQLPLAIAGEARFTSLPGGNIVRPAAFAVTELPPFKLPLGMRGEVYGQAGYVGGAFATAFADGHLRVDRRIVPLGKGELRFGAGLWGGAQRGASRLDAGPGLTLGQPLGKRAAMRLGADWRFRVAGKAAPGSGPAITLSAGF